MNAHDARCAYHFGPADVLDTGDPDTPFGMPFVPNLFKAIAHNPAGGTDATLVELMAIVDLFSGFNKMLEGLQVAPDIGA